MGRGETAQDHVAMKFICPYSEDEIVARARSWVGKPVARAEWRQGVTCIHLASFSYGWDDIIPKNWFAWSMDDLAKLSGWTIVGREPKRGDFGIFEIRGKEHLGIFTSDDTFVHAGSIAFVEAKADRFMRYFKGVLTWQ
ncbi:MULTISPECIES: hypothetical protein [Synergistaceae]|uniref:hypothetical protein n=1 Tax=Synergistaceae TaxID=649777 RepID=UPI003AE19B18|nr:hypothetical protein [Synergistaceae bacterium DZ-S4]